MLMMNAQDPSGVTIRNLGMDDYDAVLRLWTEAGLPFRPLGRDSPASMAVQLQSGTAFLLAAELEGELAGVVLGTHDGRKGWINRLAVRPALRRRGIARLLVREVEARMSAAGLEVTAALIETPNEGSLAFFKEVGYVHDEEIEYVSKRRTVDA